VTPVPGLRCSADIVFPREQVAVFVDGCFWHRCPTHGLRPRSNRSYWDAKIGRNVERDERNNAALADAGWVVVRIWEHEAVDQAAVSIEKVVRDRRASLTKSLT
jgi:DNA mismatch endonuclease (patch repair protein)